MSPRILLCLMLSSVSLTGCGVLFPEVDRPPVVLTKVEQVERPILVDPKCPPKPLPPAKPADTNTLSKPAADYFAEWFLWATECEAKNDELGAILRPAQ